MQKRTSLSAVFAVAIIVFGAAGESSAQQRFTEIDGCDVLADVVYGEIVASSLLQGYRLPPQPGQGDALSCDRTAASVSAGLARAMAAS